MKKKPAIFILALLLGGVLLAMQSPVKASISDLDAEVYSSLNHVSQDQIARAKEDIIRESADLVVCFGQEKLLSAQYPLQGTREFYAVPYVVAAVRQVGTAGSADWTFYLKLLTVQLNGRPVSAEKAVAAGPSTFGITADPNTVLNLTRLNDNHFEKPLDPADWSEDGVCIPVSAATKASSVSPNQPCNVQMTWAGELQFRAAPWRTLTSAFDMTQSIPYFNNVTAS